MIRTVARRVDSQLKKAAEKQGGDYEVDARGTIKWALGDSISAVGSEPDSFNGTYIVTDVTSNTVSFVIGSVILDGRVDVDRNGIINDLDEGTLSGIPVIAGLLDFNNDGAVDDSDDGEIFNFVDDSDGNSQVVAYAVINGYVNVDGDETVGPDTADDVIIGQNPTVWRNGFDLTRAIVNGQVDVDGDGIVDNDPDDFGSLAEILVLW